MTDFSLGQQHEKLTRRLSARRLDRWTAHAALGADLVALSLALALGAAVHVATGGRELSVLQQNLAPVVVVATWLLAIRMLGGYDAVGVSAYEGLVLSVASGLTSVVVVLQWQLAVFPADARAVAVTLAGGTILLLCGRWAVLSLVRAVRT